jgi:hypothetical protein
MTGNPLQAKGLSGSYPGRGMVYLRGMWHQEFTVTTAMMIKRDEFLKLAGLAGAACLAFPAGAWSGMVRKYQTGPVRVRPAAGVRCPPGFLRFCQAVRFETVGQALKVLGTHRNSFILYRS